MVDLERCGYWRGGRGHCVLGLLCSRLHARKIKALLPLECGLLGGVDDE